MINILSAVLAIMYMLFINVGVFVLIVSSTIRIIKARRISFNTTYVKIISALLGLSIYSIFIWIVYNQPHDYDYPGLLFMGPILFTYLFFDAISPLTESSSSEWPFLASNLFFALLGGWGLGQIVDWIRKR